MTADPLISPHGLPERLFSLGELVVDGPSASGSMRTAPWMCHDDGRPAAGLLGVVLDVVVGQPTLATRPEDTWPVTTELSIDVARTPELDGRPVLVDGELAAADDVIAMSQGAARDASGALLATAVARTRYTPGVPDLAAAGTRELPVVGTTSIRATWGGDLDVAPDGTGCLQVPPSPSMLNAAGNVHGGVLVCLADVLATAVVDRPDAPALATAAVRVTYLRPGSATGPLALTARTRHRGRATALVDVEAVGGDGRLCALGRVTFHAPGSRVVAGAP